MRRLVVAMCLLLLLALVASAQEEVELAGAKAYVEETTYDFGWIPSGATVTHAFVIHSRGTDSLKILKVRPG